MKQNSRPIVDEVAKSSGVNFDELDCAIESFSAGVVDSVFAVVEQARQMSPEHPDYLLDGFQTTAHGVVRPCGEETLGQIYREIAAPKVRNLKRAALLIFIYSFLLTGVISFFAVVLIPDQVRPSYQDNLLSGLAMYLIGPAQVKIVLQGF